MLLGFSQQVQSSGGVCIIALRAALSLLASRRSQLRLPSTALDEPPCASHCTHLAARRVLLVRLSLRPAAASLTEPRAGGNAQLAAAPNLGACSDYIGCVGHAAPARAH